MESDPIDFIPSILLTPSILLRGSLNCGNSKSVQKRPSKADIATVIASAAIPIIVLLCGMQSGLPYSFFILLRIVVCIGAFVFWAISAGEKHGNMVVLFVSICVLYNPVFPVHLAREIWIVFNVATIAIFCIGFAFWWTGLRQRRTQRD